jgi:hypothetical protein
MNYDKLVLMFRCVSVLHIILLWNLVYYQGLVFIIWRIACLFMNSEGFPSILW